MTRGVATLSAALDGVSVLGPGLEGWPQARAVLGGALAYQRAATVIPPPTTLPPAERRRASRVISLALANGYEATSGSGVDLATLTTVFASSGADSNNCHEILVTLASADRQLSPTRFHNSVHNVTAGYWSIAARDTAPYTVVCAYDGSFAAGLLEALAQVATGDRDVLLVAYDVDYPPPLRQKRPIDDAFGLGLLLRPRRGARSLALLSAQLGKLPADRMPDPALEALRAGIPAARALPLLERLAGNRAGTAVLDYQDTHTLAVTVTPCG